MSECKRDKGQTRAVGGVGNTKADGLASQPRRYRVPGQPLLNRHQVGGVSRSPDGLFAQQEREPIRGRPAVRGKRTYGGRRVEEQGTWASQKHSEAGYGRPVDRGVWTAKTVKRHRQQPAHPQYANYWAPLTRKRHTMPHSAQPQHTNYWAPRTRKRHQREHRPQRPSESSDPTQHAKGRTGDRPGPRKGTTTRRNVTQGGRRLVPKTPGIRDAEGVCTVCTCDKIHFGPICTGVCGRMLDFGSFWGVFAWLTCCSIATCQAPHLSRGFGTYPRGGPLPRCSAKIPRPTAFPTDSTRQPPNRFAHPVQPPASVREPSAPPAQQMGCGTGGRVCQVNRRRVSLTFLHPKGPRPRLRLLTLTPPPPQISPCQQRRGTPSAHRGRRVVPAPSH